jgi:hypothetical protein
MVVHQRVLPDERAVVLGGITQQTKIDETIRIVSEYICFSVSPLQDVMWVTGYNNSWGAQGMVPQESGQGGNKLHQRHDSINNVYVER